MEAAYKTLLLVEDDGIISLAETRTLRKEGYEVVPAFSGVEAVSIASGDPAIDLVLMDLNLGPGMDGTEAAELILKARDIPIVFLSAHTEQDIVERTEGITNYGYIVKDLGPTVLLTAIKMAFRLHEARLELERSLSEQKRVEAALEERILALTRPLDAGSAGLSFGDLFNVAELQRIQDAFALATGVASIIIDPEGRPITAPSSFCRLCRDFIRSSEAGEARCRESDATLGLGMPTGPVMQRCLSVGLWDGGTSITVGDTVVAKWLIGQVLEEDADLDALSDRAGELGIDKAAFREALAEVPRMSGERFERVCHALYLVARQLSRLAYQNVQQARSISEQRRTEASLRASEAHFRAIFENSSIALLEEDFSGAKRRLDALIGRGVEDLSSYLEENPGELASTLEGIRLLRANLAYRSLLGIEEGAGIEGSSIVFLPTVSPDRLRREILNFHSGSLSYVEDMEVINGDGRELALRMIMTLPPEHAGDWSSVFISFIDMTREKVAATRLEDALRDKETLMKELEHRVKNSMGLISSLFRLESSRFTDEAAVRVFEEAEDRIQTVTSIYDLLSRGSGAESIDSKAQLEELVSLFGATYLGADRGIVLEPSIESLPVALKQAAAIGLIINELLTNAVKYAYPSGRRGRIGLVFRQAESKDPSKGKELLIEVSDDGVGLPPGFDYSASGQLGFSLVSMLARQLRGELTLSSGPGLRAEVRFPLSSISPPSGARAGQR
jgi:two-component sensor histidine kinase/ligand-binding sensor protein/CheY-like chemotaxis protein